MSYSDTSIQDSDEFFDIHEEFFELYKENTSPEEVYRHILSEYAQEFEDEMEDCDHILMHEICFALAYCLWECGCKDEWLWQKVEKIIASGENLKYGWVDDPKVIKSRERALQRFWKQINTQPKRIRKPKKDRPPRQPTLRKGDLYAYQCNGGYRVALVLDYVWDSFLTAISETVFTTVPDKETAMRCSTHTVVWFSGRESIPKKDRTLITTLTIPATYNNRAGLVCTDTIVGCSSIGDRAFFFDLDQASAMMERNKIGRYTFGELLNPDVLPKYHERMIIDQPIEAVVDTANEQRRMSMNNTQLHGAQQGFFYLNIYFLLPEGYADEASFLEAVQQAKEPLTIQAVILREESETEPGAYELGVCLAPYFIADYLKEPEELVLEHPEEVYPAEVELLTQKEYNARLREQVMKHCEGCRGFGGLTKNDSSLSGHFEEITLNGFCPYRWETRNSPRNFVNELYSFGEYWGRYNYAAQSADDLIDDIKFNLKLAYTSGAILDDANGRTLILSAKKPTLIQTVLTDILGKCVSEYWEEGYHIRLNDRAEVNEDAVMNLLTPKKIAATRKEFSKYGVMIGILEFDPSGDNSVRHLLNQLVDESVVWVLHEESGKVVCLLTGKVALMRLRCASPMMEKYNAVVTVYDAQQTTQYRINFDMPLIVQDDVPVSASKENKLSKRILKAQEGKVLNYDQVFQLFAYLENRLAAAGCDNTLKYTEICLKDMLPPDRYEAAIEEIQSMGGLCDCEVLLNCYEDYELE